MIWRFLASRDGGKTRTRKAALARPGRRVARDFPVVPANLPVQRIFMQKRGRAGRRWSRMEETTMWALYYDGSQVSREYPDEAAVWRALRQAGMLDEDLFAEGYEIKRVEQERESSFV
jgi:hypothetical protein